MLAFVAGLSLSQSLSLALPLTLAVASTPPALTPPPADPVRALADDGLPAQLEDTEHMPPGLAAPAIPGAAPTPPVMLGDFASIQVNTDVTGANIAGDAANEPSLAVDPTAPNRLVIGWRQFDTIASNFRQAGNAWSDDGGRTWHNNPVLTPGVFRSDPVLDADADGVLYYNSLTGNFECQIFRSEDGGRTWSGPVDAWGGDKQWMVIDRTDLESRGFLYFQWAPGVGCCDDRIFTRSIDLGFTWSIPVVVAGNPRWGASTVGPDGTLYVAGRAGSSGAPVSRSVTASDPDAEPTFASVQVDMGGETAAFTGVNPGGLLGQMWIDADRTDGPRSGWLYLVGSVTPPGPDPLDVKFARSTDGGITWSSPRVLFSDDVDNHWQWFATMSVAPDGRIDVVTLDTRSDFSANLSELFYTFSMDGGDTWAPRERLGPPFNHHLGYPQQNKMGDYFHMRSDLVGADLAYAATYNGEQDVWYIRIGDRDCNGNGVGDEEDLLSGAAADCNRNDIPDSCEIAAGAVEDLDGDGVPDECSICVADVDGDGIVGVTDLLAVLGAWGPCAGCAADIDGDGAVTVEDLLSVLGAWGPC